MINEKARALAEKNNFTELIVELADNCNPTRDEFVELMHYFVEMRGMTTDVVWYLLKPVITEGE